MVLKNTPSTLQTQPLQHPLETKKLLFLFELISLKLIFIPSLRMLQIQVSKEKNTNSKDYKGSSAQKELLNIRFSALHQPTSKYSNLHSVHEKQVLAI